MRKILNKVTVTGADNSTHINDLIGLYKEFPFVEFGILLSLSSEGGPRFPSMDWLDDMGELKMAPPPSEEYIHTIKFMEQIRNDIEFMFSYNCLPGGKSLGYEPDKVTAMGAGTGGWPTNSNDWAKVYQKAFPEPSEGQQIPIQQDPKDMSVKAETKEDRDRLWQAVMESARGT